MTALEELAGFRADRPTVKAREKAAWSPLTPDRLRAGVVLAWDQTIRNAGWCLVASDGRGQVEIELAGTCRTKPSGLTGWEGTLSSALEQASNIEYVLYRRCADGVGVGRRIEVVHESPPSGGGKVARPDSTLLAAQAVRIAAQKQGRPVTMLANQSMKRLLFDVVDAKKTPGPGQVKVSAITKAMVGDAVAGLDWLVGRELLKNEHERDAAALGLLRLTQEVA